MDRVIKFRYVFKNNISGVICSIIWTLDEIERGITEDYHFIDKAWDLVARDELTGLTDKNGVEIYGGDIIRHNGRMESVMRYIEEDAGFKIINKNHPMMHPSKKWFAQHVEKIGSIHDEVPQ